ncbi:hypothetical protein D3C72_1935740 [compost metagenome]
MTSATSPGLSMAALISCACGSAKKLLTMPRLSSLCCMSSATTRALPTASSSTRCAPRSSSMAAVSAFTSSMSRMASAAEALLPSTLRANSASESEISTWQWATVMEPPVRPDASFNLK